MSFPSTIDSFSTKVDHVNDVMAIDVNGLQSAIVVLESKVGINSSADTGSIDYILAHKQASLGFTPENIANKSTSTALGTSDTLYPTQNAVKTYVDNAIVYPVTLTNTVTLTNKRITPRVLSAASYTTDTGTSLNCDNYDQFIVTAQAGALKLNNPSGTATEGQKLIIRIKDNGTARALTYDTQFRAMGVALPTTTVLSKTMYLGFIFNITDTKWDLVAVGQEQ